MKKLIYILITLFSLTAISQNAGELTQGVIIGGGTTDGTGLKAGQIKWDSDDLKFRKFNGTVWSDLVEASGLSNVVEDTTPQSGGDWDLNGFDITGTGNINTTGTITTSGLGLFSGFHSASYVLIGHGAGAGYPGIWFGNNALSPGFGNYGALYDLGSGTLINAPTGLGVFLKINNAAKLSVASDGNVSIAQNLTVTSDNKAATFQPYDTTNAAYGTISLDDDVYSFNRTGGTLGQINYNEGSVSVTNIENALSWKIQGSDALSANVVLDVPDKSGTIALTDDVATRARATINVQALTSSPADAATIYFGNMPKAPTTTANISKIYFRENGTITHAEIYNYSGTAGTNEAWSLYIRKNNTTDYLIATVSSATSERVFSNVAMNISISSGDYIEIKAVNPTWVTNPLTCIFGGYLKLN